MVDRAAIADSDEEDESDEEAADLKKMSEEVQDRAYGFGHVGERMQRRIPLK